jgi:ABC-type phosphate transport system substrate-binding protein
MKHNRLFSAVGVAAAFAAISTGSALAVGQPEPAQAPFVCPVLTLPDGAVSSGQFNSIGNGQYTFAPGNAGSAETFNGNVPNIATNADGSGSPGGAHSAPGDTDYTAIWSGN